MSTETAQPLPPGAEDELWTSNDVAKFLKCSLSWVRHAAADGRLPCIRIGAMVRYEPDAIRAWVRGERGGKVVILPR